MRPCGVWKSRIAAFAADSEPCPPLSHAARITTMAISGAIWFFIFDNIPECNVCLSLGWKVRKLEGWKVTTFELSNLPTFERRQGVGVALGSITSRLAS